MDISALRPSVVALLVLVVAVACAETHEGSTPPGDGGEEDTTAGSGCESGGACGGPCGSGRIACERGVARCVGDVSPRGVVCRAADGPCDLAEICDGRTVECPDDRFAPLRTRCGGPFRECDGMGGCIDTECVPGARCDTGRSCEEGVVVGCEPLRCGPAGVLPAGAPCSRNTWCDPGELCDGVGPDCPPDQHAPVGTPCLGGVCSDLGDCIHEELGGAPCTTADACELAEIVLASGAPVCAPIGPKPSGATCRPSVSACDVEEICDGASVTCPADRLAAPGIPCGSGACDAMGVCSDPGA